MMLWDGIAQSVKRLATGWTVRGSNPDKGEILRTRPDRPWGPSTLLYDGQRVSFPGVKQPRRGVEHPPPPIAEVTERVELYLYLPFVPSCQVMRSSSPCTSCSKSSHSVPKFCCQLAVNHSPVACGVPRDTLYSCSQRKRPGAEHMLCNGGAKGTSLIRFLVGRDPFNRIPLECRNII